MLGFISFHYLPNEVNQSVENEYTQTSFFYGLIRAFSFKNLTNTVKCAW